MTSTKIGSVSEIAAVEKGRHWWMKITTGSSMSSSKWLCCRICLSPPRWKDWWKASGSCGRSCWVGRYLGVYLEGERVRGYHAQGDPRQEEEEPSGQQLGRKGVPLPLRWLPEILRFFGVHAAAHQAQAPGALPGGQAENQWQLKGLLWDQRVNTKP